ncbi:MAG TPA: VIT domain-containing protein [Gemmatimonadaceae bacterium]
MRRLGFIGLGAAVGALALPALASAQGWVVPRPCDRCPPCIAGRCPAPWPSVVRASSAVRAELANGVLRYTVDESFTNRGAGLGEADYYFPLPRGAAFQELKLSVNGELVAGEVMDADEARRIYEDIVRRRRDPALVEWMGSGLLHARIFPIAPGEEKRVVVRFQVVAEREGDALRIDYRRGTARPPEEPVPLSMRRPVVDEERGGETSFTLAYDAGGEYGSPYSPTHELRVHEGRSRVAVEAVGGGSDVTVLLPIRASRTPAISVLPYATGGEDGFALITVSPPTMLPRSLPRDVTFVLDVSGSMSGRKMEQARAAGERLLETLGPEDRFRLIDFSSDVRTFRDDWTRATPEKLAAARRYLEALEAGGATNIAAALRAALAPGAPVPEGDTERADDDSLVVPPGAGEPAGRVGFVLFITDGTPTVGERDPQAIARLAARLRGARRVFTFGLGADVSVPLVEQLALEGRGTASFVRPEEDVARAVGVVATRLRDPVLADARIRASGVRLSGVLPSGPMDLFAGQDLVLLARYAGSGHARLLIEGRTSEGPVTWAKEIDFPERDRTNAFVPRLWATRRIGWLSAERRKGGGSPELDAEIRELGERYGIPTEFSSYLVQEPNAVASAPAPAPRPFGNAPTRLSEVVVAPQAAPARRDAFEAAKRAGAERDSRSLAAADSAIGLAGSAVPGGAVRAGSVRRAGDRLFVLRDGTWTDQRYRDDMRVVRIQSFSAGYFRVLALVPELRAALALGDRVRVAGRAVAIEVGPTGAAELSAADERAIRAGW